jgi:hypothetical protein
MGLFGCQTWLFVSRNNKRATPFFVLLGGTGLLLPKPNKTALKSIFEGNQNCILGIKKPK